MKPGWTGTEIRRLRELADRPRDEIAAALGRSRQAVYHQARRQGIRLADLKPGQRPAELVRKARELRRTGLSAMKIALRLGLPEATVSGWVHHGKRAEV